MADKISEENIKIGKMLQSIWEEHGVLQSELCEATGLSKNHISAVERGVSKASIKMLLGYCEKLNVTPNDILEYDDDRLDLLPELKKILSGTNREQQKRIAEMIKLMNL